MHKPVSVQENETHKILWDFDIQMDHPIQTRRPDIVFIDKNQRTCLLLNFVLPADRRVKTKESPEPEI